MSRRRTAERPDDGRFAPRPATRVLIAGSGYVGSALAIRLREAGDDVFALRRTPAESPPGIQAIAADLTRAETLVGLGDFDAVVYAASADARDELAYQRAYVTGVTQLARAVGFERFVFVSSTSVFGQSGGEWVDEDSPTEPRSFTGKRVLEGEGVVRGLRGGVVLRCGGIYGPGRTRLRDSVAAGTARWRPGHFTNRIHRDDCAGALEHLVRLGAPDPIYLGVDCEPAEERTVFAWLAQAAGAPEPEQDDGSARARGAGSKRCRNRRLLESGYAFRYPTFREGYATLA